MMMIRTLIRTLGLLGVLAVLKLAFSSSADQAQGYIDARAALLVFVMPVFILILFERDSVEWRQMMRRAWQTLTLDTKTIRNQLDQQTGAATGNYSAASLLKLTEDHPDSLVRYAGGLVTARYQKEEISKLLSERIQSEDQQWQSIEGTFSFMAKMAPYFGMLATVIGMVKLLQNMSDFAHINESMALAMQGTLYGLMSFTLLYAPLLKLLSGWREQAYQRNEMIAEWFILVASRAEGSYIREHLRSKVLDSGESEQSEFSPIASEDPA